MASEKSLKIDFFLLWSQTIVEQKIQFLGTFLRPYIRDFKLERLYNFPWNVNTLKGQGCENRTVSGTET